MGGGGWDSTSYASYSSSVSHKSREEIFVKHDLDSKLDPKGALIRESRDSGEHPESNAIIVALDVTGSMGMIAEEIAKKGLGVLFQGILDRKPVKDPQIMFMALGDAQCDSVPLQVSQFESDNKIIAQLEDIYLEGGGGGNNTESYDFPWYFAGMHTSIDCFEKRGKKGYLFTIGDEQSPAGLDAKHIVNFIGDEASRGLKPDELLALAQKQYHVFHIIIKQGNYCQHSFSEVKSSWNKLLGQRAVVLDDYTKLSETIISIIQVIEGESKEAVVASWDGSTALSVSNAINGLEVATEKNSGIAIL